MQLHMYSGWGQLHTGRHRWVNELGRDRFGIRVGDNRCSPTCFVCNDRNCLGRFCISRLVGGLTTNPFRSFGLRGCSNGGAPLNSVLGSTSLLPLVDRCGLIITYSCPFSGDRTSYGTVGRCLGSISPDAVLIF